MRLCLSRRFLSVRVVLRHEPGLLNLCYGLEPSHYRCVGRDEAVAIHTSGLFLRERLWRIQPQVIS